MGKKFFRRFLCISLSTLAVTCSLSSVGANALGQETPVLSTAAPDGIIVELSIPDSFYMYANTEKRVPVTITGLPEGDEVTAGLYIDAWGGFKYPVVTIEKMQQEDKYELVFESSRVGMTAGASIELKVEGKYTLSTTEIDIYMCPQKGLVVGDADYSGKVTLKDATLIQLICAKKQPYTNDYYSDSLQGMLIDVIDTSIPWGDDVSIKNATLIQCHLAGLQTEGTGRIGEVLYAPMIEE